MPIPLARVYEIRELLDAAGNDWRKAAVEIPEVRTVSDPGLTPELVWLHDRVAHATGNQHSLLYRDHVRRRWYVTGSADSTQSLPGVSGGTLPSWSRRIERNQPER